MELGLVLLKQLASSLMFTVNDDHPPDPSPRLSPATIISVAPDRIAAFHENPVPSADFCVIFDSGMIKVCPPGIMPRKFGVLGNPSLTFSITVSRSTPYPCTVDGSHQIRLDWHCVNWVPEPTGPTL